MNVRILAGGLLAACAMRADAQDSSYARFTREFAAGAECNRLFQLRNAARAAATPAQVSDINNKLRSVRCFDAESKRARVTSRDGQFTVKEYRIYALVVGVPMSVSATQATRNAAKAHNITETVAKAAVDKVLKLLTTNKWFATPEMEIRHASDWNGEKR